MSRLAALNQNLSCLARQIKEARRFRKVKKGPRNFRKKNMTAYFKRALVDQALLVPRYILSHATTPGD